jgi:hypothetical protein
VGVKQACQGLSVPRATWYRRREAVCLLGLWPHGGIHPGRFQKANSPPCWRVFMKEVQRIEELDTFYRQKPFDLREFEELAEFIAEVCRNQITIT